jgi:hypothetical protein
MRRPRPPGRHLAYAALIASAALLLTSCSLLVDSSGVTGVDIRTEGDGWRQLGRFRTNVPYTVRLAQEPAELVAELQWHGIDAQPQDWDPATEVLAFFSVGIGSSCPEVAVGDITIDREARLLYGRFVDEIAARAGNTPRACTADLVGSQTFVVALARERLPASPFTLRLEQDLIACHPECGAGPSEITVTLE